jgi:hypothetical protein
VRRGAVPGRRSWCDTDRVKWIVAVAVAVASCGSGACGGQGDAGEGSIAGGPAPPPPPGDPRAGPPALVASVGERAVLLDASGRVRRVLPAALRATTRPCPRGRWLVDASEWSGRVEARAVVGRRGWGKRIPVAYTQGVACLDPAARRVAVVLGGGRIKSLHVVSRGADRIVRRFRGEVPLVTATRVYVTDRRGVRAYALPSGRMATRLDAPAQAHIVSPSRDGRRIALATFGTPDRFFLVDTATGAVRPIEDPVIQLVGWLAHDRLAMRTRQDLVILDTGLRVRHRVRGFRADNSIVAGSQILSVDGRALQALQPGARSPRRAGRVPRDTWLIAPLL